MKKPFTFIIALSLAALCLAADSVQTKTRRPRRRSAPGGGLLVKPGSCTGSIRFVNVASCVPSSAIEGVVQGVRGLMPLDVEAVTSSETFSPVSADALRTKLGATEAIFVIDDKSLPMTLIAPEAGWAAVNAAPLKAGAPDDKLLATRLQRQLWRVFAQLNGAANTMFPHCVLKPVHTLADLDALSMNMVCPEPYNKMIEDLRHRGITPRRMATYRQACKEGWAPAPTNDVQRTILEQIRAEIERGPSKSITIPPPKK